jgi:phage shock protein PspC (stress-responsive transcriptional regulator)
MQPMTLTPSPLPVKARKPPVLTAAVLAVQNIPFQIVVYLCMVFQGNSLPEPKNYQKYTQSADPSKPMPGPAEEKLDVSTIRLFFVLCLIFWHNAGCSGLSRDVIVGRCGGPIINYNVLVS